MENIFLRNLFQNLLQYIKIVGEEIICLKTFKTKNYIKSWGGLSDQFEAFDCIFDDLLFVKPNIHSF